jgi:hypothetical protein
MSDKFCFSRLWNVSYETCELTVKITQLFSVPPGAGCPPALNPRSGICAHKAVPAMNQAIAGVQHLGSGRLSLSGTHPSSEPMTERTGRRRCGLLWIFS